MIGRLGFINAMNIELPFALGSGDIEKAQSIKNTVFTYNFFFSIFVIAFFVSGLLFIWNDDQNWWYAGISIMIITVLEIFSNLYEAVLRSEEQFYIIAKSYVLITPLLFIFLLLPWQYGFFGLCLRYILIEVTRFSILVFLRKIRFSFQVDKAVFKSLFDVGWKIWLWSYLKSFSKTLPRLSLVVFANTATLGLYAPVNWAQMAFTKIIASVNSYLYPGLTIQLAKKNNSAPSDVIQACIRIFLLTTPIVLVSIFVAPYAIKNFLPEYTEAIKAVQIGLAIGLAEILTIPVMIFTAKKDWAMMYTYIVFVFFTKALLLFTFIKLSSGGDLLLLVASASLISTIVAAIVLYLSIYLKRNTNVRSTASIR